MGSFLGWPVEGWHGTVSQHFRCGFYWKTRKMAPQRWWRTPGAGYAKMVPAGDKMAAGAAPMPRANCIAPRGGGRWPWAMIYSQWPPQKLQLGAHGMLMAHVRDLGFSHVCAEITTSTCMDSMLYTYMSSKHATTVHILCVVPWAQPSPSWRAPCSSNQGMCTWVNEC